MWEFFSKWKNILKSLKNKNSKFSLSNVKKLCLRRRSGNIWARKNREFLFKDSFNISNSSCSNSIFQWLFFFSLNRGCSHVVLLRHDCDMRHLRSWNYLFLSRSDFLKIKKSESRVNWSKQWWHKPVQRVKFNKAEGNGLTHISTQNLLF